VSAAIVLRRSILAALVAAIGCNRSSKVEEPPPADTAVAVTPARSAPERVVAVGDLHGDLDVTRRALRLAGVMDNTDAWVGGKTVVVQTGDQVDRGDDDRSIIDLFERLRSDAKKAGGDVLSMSGNHELMNAALDFRYVTTRGFATFDDLTPKGPAGDRLVPLDAPTRGRAAAFLPGGTYARIIAERPVVARVGDTVFVHGGVLPKHVTYGIDRINEEVKEWLLGQRTECPRIAAAEDSPVWTRAYSASGHEDCDALRDALTRMNAKRMVVGHTVQDAGINSACDGRVWRIDTGLSKYFGGKLEVLELRGDAVKTLRAPSDARH
jgi:hypothetical protein